MPHTHLIHTPCTLRTVIAAVEVIAAIAATTALAPAAVAQTPGTVQPGQIERQFQPPPEPRAKPEAIQLPAAQQTVPPGADAMRFTAKSIVVEGASRYPAEALRPLIAPLEGREASFAELIALANVLTAKYRNEGYILAQVIVPAQQIEPTDATVRLQAVEGYIDAVRFSGELGGDATRLDALAAAIKATRPLTASVLERYLLLMNDIPGLRAATTLTPSPTVAGAADLEIRLVRQPFAGAFSIDNRGSRAIGPWRATADLEASGLTGTSRTAAKIVSTGDRELLFGNLQHEQILNAEGTKLVFSVGAARARPDLNASLGTLTLETESRTLGLTIQHPLIRSRAQNLYARFGFTGYNGETLANGTRTSEDHIRALRAGLTWDRADEWFGVNIVDAEIAQGISGLGATDRDDPNKSRVNGRSDFTKGSLYAARLQSIARRWSVLVAANAQYAWTNLLAPELFGVGGEQFGRGYDPSEILGDYGAAGKVELRYTDTTTSRWLPRYTLYTFYDAGYVRRRTPVNESAHASLASTGFGFRFGAERRLSGFIEIAQPLTRVVATRNDRETRLYAGVALKF